MNIDRDVWIKYYAFNDIDNLIIEIDGQAKYVGTSSIMMYVSNDDESYNIYTYDGVLNIQRITENRVRQDILTNLDKIITEFKEYLLG